MFDKKRCINNIYFLVKDKGKKIGDIEKLAGVSAGYISRLNKEDNSTNPGIEFLEATAKELGVSLDALINYDFESITSTEAYILKVVEKLLHQTQYEERPWTRTKMSVLKDMTIDEQGIPDHPLYQSVQKAYSGETEYPEYAIEAEYHSHFLPEAQMVIMGEGFHTSMPGGTTIYLMCVTTKENEELPFRPIEIYEMYLVNKWTPEPLCFSGDIGGTPFSSVLEILYKAVVESCKHTKIKPKIKNILDAFMNETDSGIEEPLPFN